jgi:hypothetical protein
MRLGRLVERKLLLYPRMELARREQLEHTPDRLRRGLLRGDSFDAGALADERPDVESDIRIRLGLGDLLDPKYLGAPPVSWITTAGMARA